MLNYDREALAAELKRDEGYRDTPYFDSRGILTIGIGHAMGHASVTSDIRIAMEREGVMDTPWPRAVLEQLFAIDCDVHEAELERLAEKMNANLEPLSDRRIRALINMTFNMGARRLGGFLRMWAAIKIGNWEEAEVQALDSRWARQVGPRAPRVAAMLREG